MEKLIPTETLYVLKVAEPYMDKVCVFAEREKDLLNNEDHSGRRLQVKLMQLSCNAEHDPGKSRRSHGARITQPR